MTGTLVAAASGIGFGLFQSLNVRAVRGMDPYASTFLQIFVAALALGALAVATGGVADLDGAPASALIDFAAAGLLHFIAGWTCLNVSQKRIGAARTSPLLVTVPLFGIAIAAVSVGQLPAAIEWPAMALMIAGAYVVASRGTHARPARLVDALPALGCAFCWALSPVLTLRGLEDLNNPLLGITLGLVVSVLGYGLAFAVAGRDLGLSTAGREALAIKLVAGVLVGLSTWARWAALDSAAVAVVLTLNLLSVPVVLVGAPLVSGRHMEPVGRRVWGGAGLVVAGSLLLIALG